MVQSSTSHLPHIDGLRAVAVLLVVAYHAWPQHLPGGFIGVDIFFVISGFLITRLIVHEIELGQFSLLNFYVRRIRRLMPAAVVVCVVTAAIAAIIMLPHDLRLFGRSLTAASLLVSNFHFANDTGYFAPSADTMPLLHTWSLAVEEQFYLVWPLILLSLAGLGRIRWALVVCVAGSLASLMAAVLPIPAGESATAEPGRWFFMPWARVWELGVGASLAFVLLRHESRQSDNKSIGLAARACVLLGVVMIGVSAILLSKDTIIPGPTLLPPITGAALVIVGGMFTKGAPPPLLSWRPVVFIGLISYSLYLWHWPLFSLARYQLQRPLLDIELAVLIGVSLVLAAASWRWVEQPFRAADRNPIIWLPARIRYGVIVAAVALTVGLAGLGGAMNGGKGWPWRYSANERVVLRQMSSGSPLRPACDGHRQAVRNDDLCNVGRSKSEDASYDGVLFGDSNADHFVPGLAAFANAEGLSLRQVTQSQCGPLLGFRSRSWNLSQTAHCLDYQRQILDFLDKNKDLRLAILAAHWQRYHFEDRSGARDYQPVHSILPQIYFQVAARQGFQNSDIRYYLSATIAYLRSRKIQIHLIGQVPHIDGGLPVQCALRAVNNNGDVNRCGVGSESALKALAPSNDFLFRLQRDLSGVTVTLPSDFLCVAERCSLMWNGVFLYRDPGHLSGVGARALSDKLMPSNFALVVSSVSQ